MSLKFPEKANLELADVTALIAANPHADVALFSSRWLYLLWFDNVWTQGVHRDYIAQPIHNVDPGDSAHGLRRLLRLTYASKKLAKGSGRAGRLGFKIARKLAVLAHGRKQSAFKGARTG